MKETTIKYPSTTRLFYLIMAKIFVLVKENLALFADHKASYTDVFIDQLIVRLADANALPSTAGSIADRALKRIALKNAATPVREKWQGLKTYVEAAFPQDQWEQRINCAGAAQYLNTDVNWGATKEMAEAATEFITVNLASLTANNNMPAGFAQSFTNAAQVFYLALSAFNTAQTVKVNARKTKINANNTLYEAGVTISKDAAVIFKRDETKRKQFSYAYQLAVLKGGAANLKGYLKDEGGNALEGVSISCTTVSKYAAVTNSKGYFHISKMSEGDNYIFVFSKPGFVSVEETISLKTGTSKTIRLTMTMEGAGENVVETPTDMKQETHADMKAVA